MAAFPGVSVAARNGAESPCKLCPILLMARLGGLQRAPVDEEKAPSSKKKRILSPLVRKYSSLTWDVFSPGVKRVRGWEERGIVLRRELVSSRRAEIVAGERTFGMMR